ncbi:MAG: response regulator transcription factor [Eubacteriales bacterium]|nr:response regulator transcription factor [Eubacteriales bacterium]
MAKILIVEDEADIQELLKNYLNEAGYELAMAGDGVEALNLAAKDHYDLILLDVMLPKIDGFGVLEVIRRESEVPVIMLTALDGEEFQIRGYDLQVDEYVTKPFSMPVLLRKIAAVLRRTSSSYTEKEEYLIYKDLKLDLQGYHAWMNERELDLTQKEFELLREFLLNLGRVLTRGQLLDLVWGMDYFGEERIVDTHIKNLRKKLQADYIETIRGVGYRIDKIH